MGDGALSGKPAAIQDPGYVRKRFALLVGVNRFADPTYPTLRYCVNDVEALEKVLSNLGYDVTSLHDNQAEGYRPTRSNILSELNRICAAASAPDDLVLVHIATHGQRLGDRTVLLASDTIQAVLEGTSICLQGLEAMMKASNARKLVLSLDACHTGYEGAITRWVPDPDFLKYVYDSAEGFAVMAATTSQSVAYELPDKKHGLFSYFLIEAMQGKSAQVENRITLANVQNYILHGMQAWAEERRLGAQLPQFKANGYGDMVLAEFKAAPVTGNPFSDEFHYGREIDLEETFEELAKGNNIALLGPEQIGKSLLLRHVYQAGPVRLGNREFHYLSLEYVENPDEFYVALQLALKFDRVLRGVLLNESLKHRRIVLCIDELERFGRPEFQDVTSLLRGLSNGNDKPLKMVATSRSELKTFLGSGGKDGGSSSLANAFLNVRLKPFQTDEIRGFLQDRLRGTAVRFTEDEIESLAKISGGVPGRLRDLAFDLFRAKRRAKVL